MGKWRDRLVIRLDDFAMDLLEETKKGSPESLLLVSQKGVIFDKLTRWVAIKNKIEDPDEDKDGAAIRHLKDRIKGREADKPERRGPGRPAKPKPAEPTGTALAALKRALPPANGGGAEQPRHDAVGAVSAAAGHGRGVHAGVPDDDEPDGDDADRERDL